MEPEKSTEFQAHPAFLFIGAKKEFESVKKLYVGNLPFSANEDEIRDLFAAHGTVHSVNLISDRETGRPRGFGFVEMDEDGANAAMTALDGTDFNGRNLRVNEAQERQRRGGANRGKGRTF